MFLTPMIIPLPDDKILDMTELKAFAVDKLNVDKMTFSLLDRVENKEGKGENACYQHFLLFPQCFQGLSSLWSGLSGKELKEKRFNTCKNIRKKKMFQ